MKAAVLYEGGKPLVIEEVTLDPPKAHEVRVRVAAAGVCHSDWHTISGDSPSTLLPQILGHEGAGVVEEVGADVSYVKPGDHVILLYRPACGRCDVCSRGKPSLCPAAAALGATGKLYDGTSRLHRGDQEIRHYSAVSCFAEQCVVPDTGVLKIGDDIPLDIAALVGCAVIAGVGAVVNTARVEPGSSVLVIGAGGIGLSAVMGAHLAGAYPIIACDVVDSKLDKARELGASHVIRADREDVVQAVKDATGGEGADFAFEAIGKTQAMAQAFDALYIAGTAVVIGLPAPGAELPVKVRPLIVGERTLKGSFNGSNRPYQDLPRLLKLYRGGRLPLDRLLTNRYPLDQINEAYADLLGGRVARAVIVEEQLLGSRSTA